MRKLVAAMLSYKMGHLTSRTCTDLEEKVGLKHGKDLFVFENGPQTKTGSAEEGMSINQVSPWVTHFTGENLRMTGGFNWICDWFNLNPHIVELHDDDYLWLCTNDFEVTHADMDTFWKIHFGTERPALIHPSLEDIPGYAYPWMFKSNCKPPSVEMTWMVDFICPMIHWGTLKKIHDEFGHWFDPAFVRGWGIDYETCYRVRQMGWDVLVDPSITIKHEASKTYEAGVAPEKSVQEFYDAALEDMRTVMVRKYGPGWLEVMKSGT